MQKSIYPSVAKTSLVCKFSCLFKKYFHLFFRETGREREKEKLQWESRTSVACLPCPYPAIESLTKGPDLESIPAIFWARPTTRATSVGTVSLLIESATYQSGVISLLSLSLSFLCGGQFANQYLVIQHVRIVPRAACPILPWT